MKLEYIRATTNLYGIIPLDLPLLSPTIFLIFISTLSMATEYVFTPIHVLTGGGPVNASTNIVFEIWRQAFRWFRVGYSSVTLPIWLRQFMHAEGGSEWGMLMAASSLGVVPALIIYMLSHRQIMSTFASTGIKG